MIDVIYLTDGRGVRAKLGYPKQYARLGGKPIMVHGLELLQGMREINRIIIPIRPAGDPTPENYGEEHPALGMIKQYGITKAFCVDGGITRQSAVCGALLHVMTEYVLIAEGVRPFITVEFVRSVIGVDAPFVTPWISSLSTALTRDGEYLDRDNVGQVQMPQKYKTKMLRLAHNRAYAMDLNNTTDDAALVIQTLGLKPVLMPGIEENIKITSPIDLVIAEAIYRAKYDKKGE